MPASKTDVQLPRADILHILRLGESLQSPPSYWRQSESKLFTQVLQLRAADVLVVPFEVQDRGFDRIERSLMTADLAYALERQSPNSVADPYLATRALGEGQRTHDWLEVARLADAINARTVVRGYVGHDGNRKLTLTLTVQRRLPNGSGWTNAAASRRDWRDLPFSDEHLPNNVVHELLPEILTLVAPTSAPASATASASVSVNAGQMSWPLPESPFQLVTQPPATNLGAAERFALLAALAPEWVERTRERLAERGLLSLGAANDSSSRARFFEAYFLHLLHRRPAAVAALDGLDTPESAALQAVLNGNLDLLQQAVTRLPDSVDRLLMEFELCTLQTYYEAGCAPERLRVSSELARRSTGWNALVVNRLSGLSGWEVQSNAALAPLLDTAFPIPGFGLQDLLRSELVIGDPDSARSAIDLSVVRHVREALTDVADLKVSVAHPGWPDRMDYLQLLEGLAEVNLLKRVYFVGTLQGLTSDALDELRSYEKVYDGHPAFSEEHASLLRAQLAHDSNGEPVPAIAGQLAEAVLQAAYLEQGQSTVSYNALNDAGTQSTVYMTLGAAYSQDFPSRPWWTHINLPPSQSSQAHGLLERNDSKEWRLAALAYSEKELPTIDLNFPDMPLPQLQRLLDQRFRGHPQAGHLLARLSGTDGSKPDSLAAYRESIRRNPATWSNYEGMGDELLDDGDLVGAARAYLSYPGFHGGARRPGDDVSISNNAFESGSGLYWRGNFEGARALFEIAAANEDGSYASIASASRLALLKGDLITSARYISEAAHRYQGEFSYRDYLSMLHAFGMHREAWSGFNSLTDRFAQPEVWVAALVGQRMAGTTAAQLRQWLLSPPIKGAHFLGHNLAVDYALLWNSIDRKPDPDLARLLEEIEGPSSATVEAGGLATSRPSWRTPGVNDYIPTSDFRASSRQRSPAGAPVRDERVMFADAYVELREGHYAEAVQKFDELAAHYGLQYESERYVIPYFAFASAKTGDPLHLEAYLDSAHFGDDFAVFLAKAFFVGLRGQKAQALEYLSRAFYSRPYENTDPIFSEYRYAETCEWLYNETHEDAYRQRALDWARMQQRTRPELSWPYALEARLAGPGGPRDRALAMTLYFDPAANVVASLPGREKSRLKKWLSDNNPFMRQSTGFRAVGANDVT